MPRDKEEGIGARQIASIAGEDAQAGEKFVLGQIEAFAHPGRLKGGKIEAAQSEGLFKARRPAAAERALRIVENPAGEPIRITKF